MSSCKGESQTPDIEHGDMLREVFYNLISRAIKL